MITHHKRSNTSHICL